MGRRGERREGLREMEGRSGYRRRGERREGLSKMEGRSG